MKTKIISILIGMGIMGVLVGCGQAITQVKAGENGYLKYCGVQENVFGDKYKNIEIYEDAEHGNVIYIATDKGGRDTTITAIQKH
jgi:hypothetical protein